ncbi:protocadherin-11 X-linked-like [Ptychodera flava]|uniref:protocadherin-11 X-linked-like n=1 Tax=Ptychodera flava TaxID=63121 RepID=UPI003969D82C
MYSLSVVVIYDDLISNTLKLNFSELFITLELVAITTTTITIRWFLTNETYWWRFEEYLVIDLISSEIATSRRYERYTHYETTFDGLRPGTSYTVTVSAIHRYWAVSFNTSDSLLVNLAPEPPVFADVIYHNTTSVFVYWNPGCTDYDTFEVTYVCEDAPFESTENVTYPNITLFDLPSNSTCFIDIETISNGLRSETSYQLQINTLDVKDTIRLTSGYKVIHVTEEEQIRNPVFDVSSLLTDPNAAQRYDLLPNAASSTFLLDNLSGKVNATIDKFDYEEKDRYELEIDIVDLEGATRVLLIIVVENINDNRPNFTNTLYESTIMEYAPFGSLVAVVTAIDGDVDAKLTYYMSSQDNYLTSLFSIGQDGKIVTEGTVNLRRLKNGGYLNDGTVRIAYAILLEITIEDVNDEIPTFGELSYSASIREDAGSLSDQTQVVIEYQLTVVARDRDGADHGNSNSVPFTVEITDANDNSPVFRDTEQLQNLTISEDSPIATVLTTIQATDADEGFNSELRFYIHEGGDGKFRINYNTGELSLRSELDRETKDKYILGIIARDQGYPARETLVNVSVTVLDVNDNSPRFDQQFYNGRTLEGQMGSTILTVIASDPDFGENAEIEYSLTDPSNFTIGSDGVISATFALDRERVPSYDLVVIATDGGKPSRSSSSTVRILVDDVNDNEPKFSSQQFETTMLLPSDGIKANSLVTIVSATDLDFGSNAEITYSVLSEKYISTFDIGRIGAITVDEDYMPVSGVDDEILKFISLLKMADLHRKKTLLWWSLHSKNHHRF